MARAKPQVTTVLEVNHVSNYHISRVWCASGVNLHCEVARGTAPAIALAAGVVASRITGTGGGR